MQEIKEKYKLMGKYLKLLNGRINIEKYLYYQSNLQIQCNSYQNPKYFFQKNGINNSEI